MSTVTLRIDNGDWVMEPTGRPAVVADSQKLKQDVEQMLGQNEAPEGARLDAMVGQVSNGPFAVRAILYSRVQAAAGRLRAVQRSSMTADRSREELLDHVAQVEVSALPGDSTGFVFSVSIVSAANATVTATGALAV